MTAIPQEAFFVSTAWLADHLGAPDVALIDGTFFLPDEKRDAKLKVLKSSQQQAREKLSP
jgi:thiosulfate/3-mercaptopyruvate sulfurtransferase